MSSPIVLDFEGFQVKPQSYIIKELAFYSLNDGYHNCWAFGPPHPWKYLTPSQKKSFHWVIRNRHGMEWNSGILPYSKLRLILEYLSTIYPTIYVKGVEKIKFLQALLNREILSVNCPEIKKLNVDNFSVNCCFHPTKSDCCALLKAATYATYIKHHLQPKYIISIHDVLSEGCGMSETPREKSKKSCSVKKLPEQSYQIYL